MAYPTIEGVGAGFASAGGANATCDLPAHDTNDILVFGLQNYSNADLTFNQNTAGFAKLAGVGGTNRRLNVYWVRAVNSSTVEPSITCPTNHQLGAAICIRGCKTTGNPFDTPATRDFAASGTGWSWDEVTPSLNESLICFFGGAVRDNTGGWMGDLSNANLSDLTEHFDGSITTNAGGGLFIGSGTIATAAAIGATTGTAAGNYAGDIVTVSFIPAVTAGYSRNQGFFF